MEAKRHRRRGSALIVLLMLAAALLVMFTLTLRSYMQLHRQNRSAAKRLQQRAESVRVRDR